MFLTEFKMMVSYLVLISLLITGLETAPPPRPLGVGPSADTPRTGGKWPPYKNADKDFWEVEAEKIAEKFASNIVKKSSPNNPSETTTKTEKTKSSEEVLDKNHVIKKSRKR